MSKVSDAIEALDWLQVPEYAEASRKTIEQAAPRMAALLTKALPWLYEQESIQREKVEQWAGRTREKDYQDELDDLRSIIAEIEGKEDICKSQQ